MTASIAKVVKAFERAGASLMAIGDEILIDYKKLGSFKMEEMMTEGLIEPEEPQMYVNPITTQGYVDKKEYVQSLIAELVLLERAQKQYAKERAELTKAAEDLIPESESIVGKHTLEGVDCELIVELRESAKYERPRGAIHPLEKLLPDHPLLATMVRATIAESGSKIQKLMDKRLDEMHSTLAEGTTLTDAERALADELAKVRRVEPATTVLKVKGKGVELAEDDEAE